MQVQGQYPHQWAPLPGGWLAACMADLTTRSPGVSIMRVDSPELPLSAIPLCQLPPNHLRPPGPTLSNNLYVKGCLDCAVGAYQGSLLSFRMRSRSSMPSHASSSVDRIATVFCGFTLQICLIIALISLQMLEVGLCQWPSFTGMEHCTPHTRAVHTATCLEREKAGRENWYQLLELLPRWFSHVFWSKTHNHWLLRSCLLGSKRKLPPPACQARLGLPSVVCRQWGVQFPGTVYTCDQGFNKQIFPHWQ